MTENNEATPKIYNARIPGDLWAKVEQRKKDGKVEYIETINDALRLFFSHEATSENVVLTLRHGATCGEWKDTNVDPSTFEISQEQAAQWGVKDDDELIETFGASMLEAGIPERAMLLMRGYGKFTPTTGDICSVFVTTKDGATYGTIKRWEWASGQKTVRLTNGKGKEIDLPEGADMVHAISKWTGHLLTY